MFGIYLKFCFVIGLFIGASQKKTLYFQIYHLDYGCVKDNEDTLCNIVQHTEWRGSAQMYCTVTAVTCLGEAATASFPTPL